MKEKRKVIEKKKKKKKKKKKLLVGWVLWHINLCSLFNAKYIFIQIINSISNNSL